MYKWIAVLLIVVMVFAGGFFTAKSLIEPEIINSIDTLLLEAKPQVVWQTAYLTNVVHDTIIVVNNDTVFIESGTANASGDTTFEEGRLKTQYFFPPVNKFKYDWDPNPPKVIIKTEYVTKPIPWYWHPAIYGVGGLVVGAWVRGM
jgi:hypothetical protein